MKRIISICLALLCAASPAFSQVTKSTLLTNVGTTFADNASGNITPATVRTFFTALINSFQQAPAARNVTGTTDTIGAPDYGQLITYSNAGSIAVSVPQITGSFTTFNFAITNLGAGTATFTPAGGTLINGASSLAVASGNAAIIISDGTNYQILRTVSSGGTVTGPGTTTDTALASWNGTAGTLLRNNVVTLNPGGVLAGVTGETITANSLTPLAIQDAISSQDILKVGVVPSTNCDGGYVGTPGNGPCSQVALTQNGSNAWSALALTSTNSRVLIGSIGSGGNPEIIVADTNVFGIPVWGGGNQAGVGFVTAARTGSGQPSFIPFVNLGASSGTPTGAEGSMDLEVYSGSNDGQTQGGIFYFNATGCTKWSTSTCSATQAGGRLGEDSGSGMSADGLFTQTETASMNFYADAAFTGTHNDGSYTAKSNIVFAEATATNTPEGVVGGFYSPGTFAVGAWARSGNSFTGGLGTITMKGGAAVPSAMAGTGILYVTAAGVLHYRGPTSDTPVAGP